MTTPITTAPNGLGLAARHDGRDRPLRPESMAFPRGRAWRRVLRDAALLAPHNEALLAQRLAAIEAIRGFAA